MFASKVYSVIVMTLTKTKSMVLALAVGVTAAIAATAVQQHSTVATVASGPAPTAGYRDVVKRVTPAVVDVAVTKVVKASNESGPEMDPFFRRFFGPDGPQQQQPNRRSQGSGSGVIINKDGYVLTNNHVVEGATDIRVRLRDQREFKATVLGTDPKTDIAVIKIEASGLPYLKFADSSTLEVGDTVLAVGNPFGIGQTVTQGIVSATGRSNLGIEDYEDFIQTDAAVNKGNSGGALVNSNGDLVGINTAIMSGSGGNNGVAFAIPSNMALGVMDQLLKNGSVKRAQLGVVVQAVTPALAKTFGLKDTKGALIGDVTPDSPAAQAGIKAGDVITSMNGKPVDDNNQLRNRIAMTEPGSKVALELIRDGQTKSIAVKLGELTAKNSRLNQESESKEQAAGGIDVEELTPDAALRLDVSPQTKGVVIRNLDPESFAAHSGLRKGDVIVQVNRKPVVSANAFRKEMKSAGSEAVLLVNRGGHSFFVTLQ